jgi:hypothetical protein
VLVNVTRAEEQGNRHRRPNRVGDLLIVRVEAVYALVSGCDNGRVAASRVGRPKRIETGEIVVDARAHRRPDLTFAQRWENARRSPTRSGVAELGMTESDQTHRGLSGRAKGSAPLFGG